MQVVLRPAVASDLALLTSVYASTRTDELSGVSWDAGTRDAFLSSQFAAQERAISTCHPDAVRLVVVADGRDVGRLYRVELAPAELRLLDLALLPDSRRRGIGDHLVRRLADEADARRLLLSLHVAHGNPAQRLYTRHGFAAVAEDEVRVRMERRPRPAAS